MSENKKYYWLKLPKDFFEDRAIKKLRSIAGGDTYTIIYLKMLLRTLEDGGKFVYEGIEDSIVEEIALDIDEKEEDVSVAVNYLIKKGLMVCTENEAELTRMHEMIGSETDKAKLMRKKREQGGESNKVTENGNNVTHLLPDVTNCYTEKEKEIDKEIDKEISSNEDIKKCSEQDVKENDNESPEVAKPKAKKPKKNKYGDYSHVLLTEEEYLKLHKDYPNADEIIQFLDSYIEEKGYKANSHYLSIKRWVVNAVKEDNRRSKGNRYMHTKSLPPYMNDNGEVDIPPKEEASDEDKQKAIDELNSLMKVLNEN